MLLDKNVTWKEHLKYIENKCTEYVDLLYKENHRLNKKCLLALYHSYVNTYIDYANKTWGSTYLINLKRLHSKQKHAIRIVHDKTKFEYTRHLFRKNKILNVYQLNTLNNVMFMHIISTKTVPLVFYSYFQRSSQSYPTNFSESNYSLSYISTT